MSGSDDADPGARHGSDERGRAGLHRDRWRRARAEMLDRQRWRLLALSLICVLVFLGTAAVARVERQWHEDDARATFVEGDRALAGGNAGAAVTALQRAVLLDRSNVTYGLALASALSRSGAAVEAERELQRLRRGGHGGPRISVALARLLGARGSIAFAIQHYEDALHDQWTDGEERQAVRVELIQLLLDHHRQTRALAETLVLAANSADSAAAQGRLGRLYLAAGDPVRAAAAYRRVTAADPDDMAARVGLGTALFQLGNYREASRQLAFASTTDDSARELRELGALVLVRDPLEAASRRQRQQRLTTLAAHALLRADLCAATTPSVLSSVDGQRLEALRAAIRPVRPVRPTIPPALKEEEAVEHAISVAAQIEELSAACGPPDLEGRATVLIAKRHASSRAL